MLQQHQESTCRRGRQEGVCNGGGGSTKVISDASRDKNSSAHSLADKGWPVRSINCIADS